MEFDLAHLTLAIMAALPAIAGGIASAGASYGLSALTGGGGSGDWQGAYKNAFQGPVGFSGGGLLGQYSGGQYTVGSTAERLAAVRGIQDQLTGQAGEIGNLRPMVAPGMSELRNIQLGEIAGAREAAIGNLRENLQRRSVLGSSFGADALSRAEAEFGGARASVAAKSLLQELELTNNLINQQYTLKRQAFQTGLDNLNLEAGLAAQLSSKASDLMQKSAQFLSEMTAKEAAAKGKFFGDIFQPLTKGIGQGVYSAAGGKGTFLGGTSGTSPGSTYGNTYGASSISSAGVS